MTQLSQQKAIFLDRDGLINDNSTAYYVYKIEEFKFNEGVFECLKVFCKKHYKLIIITNQGGIARGQYSKADVEKLHEYMLAELRKQNIEITDIFYCPHHSDVSKCLCRKPNSLLIEKAVAKYNIDKEKSVMIGDSDRDIEAAQKIGIKGIKTPANQNLFDFLSNSKYAYLLQ